MQVDEIVLTLQSRAQHWSDLDLERKADLLESCLENIWECTESVIEVTLCQKVSEATTMRAVRFILCPPIDD